MSILREFTQTRNAIEELEQRRKQMLNDPKLQKILAFKKQYDDLVEKAGLTDAEALSAIGATKLAPSQQSSMAELNGERKTKRWTLRATGESVEGKRIPKIAQEWLRSKGDHAVEIKILN